MVTNGNITISSEDVKLIRKFEDIRQRGYYCNGAEVTVVYNRVLNKNVASTNCSSCIRSRIQELVNALNQFERKLQREQEMASNSSNEQELNNVKEEENKAVTDAGNEDVKARMAKVRGKKKE